MSKVISFEDVNFEIIRCEVTVTLDDSLQCGEFDYNYKLKMVKESVSEKNDFWKITSREQIFEVLHVQVDNSVMEPQIVSDDVIKSLNIDFGKKYNKNDIVDLNVRLKTSVKIDRIPHHDIWVFHPFFLYPNPCSELVLNVRVTKNWCILNNHDGANKKVQEIPQSAIDLKPGQGHIFLVFIKKKINIAVYFVKKAYKIKKIFD